MASFDEIVSKMTAAIKGVREAVLGKDVREFIASGYESMLDAYKQLDGNAKQLKEDLDEISDVYYDAGFENYSVTTDLIETENSTRLISAKVTSNKNFNTQNIGYFNVSDGYEFRILEVTGNIGVYTDWLTELSMGAAFTSYDYLRFAVRNKNNTSATITSDEVSIGTNIKEFIHYKKSATKEEVESVSKRIEIIEENNNPFNLNIVSTGKENMMWSWWYYPQVFSFKRVRNKIYWGYTTSDGYTGIAEYNEDTHEIKKNHLKKSDIDDHNGLSVYILPNGTILCAYSGGHNTDNAMHIRLSSVPECIDNFEDEICLESVGTTSYGQIVYAGGKYWLFYRVNNGTWAYRTTTDGINWTPEILLLYSALQYYCRFVPTTDDNIIRMVMASNPGEKFAMIRQCFINIDEGKIYDNDMSTKIGNITDTINKNNVSTIIPLEDGKTQRLFDVAITDPQKTLILYCKFTTLSFNDSVYMLYDSGNNYEICSGGEALWHPKYQDGCAFINTSKIISIRGYEGSDIVEIYDYIDNAVAKNKQVFSEIKGSIPIRNARPIVDVNGNYAVWHRGYYNTTDYTKFNSDAKLYDIINDNLI